MADHSLKTGSGGFEVKVTESFTTEDKDATAPDGRDFSAMCRIGWTVKDWNDAFLTPILNASLLTPASQHGSTRAKKYNKKCKRDASRHDRYIRAVYLSLPKKSCFNPL